MSSEEKIVLELVNLIKKELLVKGYTKIDMDDLKIIAFLIEDEYKLLKDIVIGIGNKKYQRARKIYQVKYNEINKLIDDFEEMKVGKKDMIFAQPEYARYLVVKKKHFKILQPNLPKGGGVVKVKLPKEPTKEELKNIKDPKVN